MLASRTHEACIRLQSHHQESSNISLGQRCLKNWLKTSQAWKASSLYSTKQTWATACISKPLFLHPVPASSLCNLEGQTKPTSHPWDTIPAAGDSGVAAALVLQSTGLQCLAVCAPTHRQHCPGSQTVPLYGRTNPTHRWELFVPLKGRASSPAATKTNAKNGK